MHKVLKAKIVAAAIIGACIGAVGRWTSEQNKLMVSVTAVLGVVGACLSRLLGGWDMALQTLIGFMSTDYITGITVAAVFQRSNKTEGGALSSAAGLRGLFKKGGMLLLVYVACQLDLLIGADYIRDTVVIALVSNETVSITENLILMGVPIPEIVKKAIDTLKKTKEVNSK
ncbi:MAG: phage holin family protein [Candidatus Fimivivens sp.]|nr:phage holin family protein [Candidatus Fimivivens sp.]